MTPTYLLIALLSGIAIGLLIYDKFLVPQFETKIKSVTRTEYVPYEVKIETKEYIYVDVPVPVYVKDTVINEKELPINNYTGIARTLYGPLHYQINTAGYLLDYKFKPEFSTTINLPHTITTNTEVKIKEPRGLYALGSINTVSGPSVGLAYLNRKVMIQYNYGVTNHTLSFGYRLF